MIKQSIDKDIKTAMLAGDKEMAMTLRTIKSVILDGEVASGKRQEGLDEESVINLLIKESKKRQDAANIYLSAGDQTRADKELSEKVVIDKYLPDMMTDVEIEEIAKEIIDSLDSPMMANMGVIIGQVKARAGALADGSTVAKIVKELLK